MNSSAPLIGFDRYVELDWCRATFDVAAARLTHEQLCELVSTALPGKESQRKTIDILKRLSTKPFPRVADFIARGLEIYRDSGKSTLLPVAWGSAVASYPFFGKTAETTGRLLALHGDCSIKEIQRRMAEAYGDRSGIGRAVARVLQSQANWGVLERDESEKRVLKKAPQTLDSDPLTAWLIEAAVRHIGKPVPVQNLQSLPVLFPFLLTRPLSYVISSSSNLELRSEGPSNQSVALRTNY
jgi:hypothetical protein